MPPGKVIHSAACGSNLAMISVLQVFPMTSATPSIRPSNWALADAGELVFPTEEEVHDVDALLALIERATPTHTLMVPSLYGALLARNGGRLSNLTTVIVAGEACPSALVATHMAQSPDVELVNEYGPTEATVWATAHRCTPLDVGSVSIGGPIPGVSLEVVGTAGLPVPIDAAGELWVSQRHPDRATDQRAHRRAAAHARIGCVHAR